MTRRGPVTLLLVLVALPLAGLVCQGCVGRMFYHPDREVYDTPARHGLPYEEVTFPSRDDTRLTGWFVPAIGTPKGTVIHFHGNAQNMTAHFAYVAWLPAEGFNLFVFDYRGYGKSAGKPDRQGVYEDSLAALNYVERRPDIAHDRLIVLGQSLGGANAIVALGSSPRRGVRAVAIDSAFSSYLGIVRDKLREMPLLSWFRWPLSYLLIGDRLSPEAYIGRIAPTPLLLIHGTADGVIPYGQGKRLFERAGEPKQFWTIDGGNHTEAFAEPGSPYRRRLVDFFNEALGKGTLADGKQPQAGAGNGTKREG